MTPVPFVFLSFQKIGKSLNLYHQNSMLSSRARNLCLDCPILMYSTQYFPLTPPPCPPPPSVRAALEGGGILSALEVSRGVSTLANNAIHLNMLNDRVSSTELGDLVMQVTRGRVLLTKGCGLISICGCGYLLSHAPSQDLFGSQEGHKQLYKERRIFLFERALIHTKRRRDNSDKESYVVKEQLMVSSNNQ